jgi:glutaminyl-tRNA synthetase
LFKVEDPASEAGDYKDYLNPDSLKIIKGFAEVSISDQSDIKHFQFLRKGYYAIDKESDRNSLIFNRTVGLKDGWKPQNS